MFPVWHRARRRWVWSTRARRLQVQRFRHLQRRSMSPTTTDSGRSVLMQAVDLMDSSVPFASDPHAMSPDTTRYSSTRDSPPPAIGVPKYSLERDLVTRLVGKTYGDACFTNQMFVARQPGARFLLPKEASAPRFDTFGDNVHNETWW